MRDLPEAFLPEFPPAIFLTTRVDLGDVSKGQLVTTDNFQEIFQGILNAKDLEGLRLLVTQFPQQQFNATADRKTNRPDGKLGVFFKNQELWVANFGDHAATVYKRDANGDAPPMRVIRSAPIDAPAPELSNPHTIAFDSKRDQILVSN